MLLHRQRQVGETANDVVKIRLAGVQSATGGCKKSSISHLDWGDEAMEMADASEMAAHKIASDDRAAVNDASGVLAAQDSP